MVLMDSRLLFTSVYVLILNMQKLSKQEKPTKLKEVFGKVKLFTSLQHNQKAGNDIEVLLVTQLN